MIRSVVFFGLLLSGALLAQSASPNPSINQSSFGISQTAAASVKSRESATPAHRQPDSLGGHAGRYYRLVWGIDELSVKSAEAGEIVRFTYRVVEAQKAKTLSDKKLEPSLIDERAHVKLVVPMMDKVGKLRQTADPEPGKTYWMLFSNKGGHVKRGDRVNVVIGNFHANGLVVD